jgi:multicomponent Na+:H+ antiporter subunit E
MKKTLVNRSILFALLWWVLAEGRHDGWALGVVAVLAATWASLRLSPPGDHPIRIAGLIHFLSFFLWHSIRGGIQVAGMAFRGRTALQPGLIEFSVNLPPGGPRILLTNTLSLMPGTLGVELSGTSLQLHVLDERLPIVAETQALQAVIARLFGASA